MQLAKLGPGQAASAAYRVPTARRGLIRTGPLRALHRDVLGLTQRTTTLAGTEEVLIVPHTIALPFPSVGSSGRLGQHLRMKSWGQTGTEFHSLREYQRGDDIRRINWKASARSTALIVRETASKASALHGGLDMARSRVRRELVRTSGRRRSQHHGKLCPHRCQHTVPHQRCRPPRPDVAANALRWLAAVEPVDNSYEMPRDQQRNVGGMGLLVIVTGSATSAARHELRAADPGRNLGHRVC